MCTHVTHIYLKCTLNFNKYTHLYSLNFFQDIKCYHYPRKFPYACSSQFLFSLAKAVFIFLRRLILPFWEFHSNGFLHYIYFCLTFTEHAFEHVVIYISNSILLLRWYSIMWIYHSLVTFPLKDTWVLFSFRLSWTLFYRFFVNVFFIWYLG